MSDGAAGVRGRVGVALAVVGAMGAMWLGPAVADTTTTTTGSTTTTDSTTTTLPDGCIGPGGFILTIRQLHVSPATFAVGQTVQVSGSNIYHLETDGDCTRAVQDNGPQSLYLELNGHEFLFGVVTVANGTFSTDLVVPTTITERGAGVVQLDSQAKLDDPEADHRVGEFPAAVTVVDAAPVAAPVSSPPHFTG